MRLAEHPVFGEIGILRSTVITAVEDRAEGEFIRDDLVEIAEATKDLIFLTDVPVDSLIPLNGVVLLAYVCCEIVEGFSTIRIRKRIHVEDVLSHRIDISRAEDILSPTAWSPEAYSSSTERLVKVDRTGIAREIRIEQFGKVTATHLGRRYGIVACLSDRKTVRLDIAEIKYLVLPYRKSKSSAELVLMEWRNRK